MSKKFTPLNNSLKQLKHSNTKAIIILGGSIIKDEHTGKWRTTYFDEQGDNYGALGDHLRVEAAVYLFKNNPNTLIIASGGKGFSLPFALELNAGQGAGAAKILRRDTY